MDNDSKKKSILITALGAFLAGLCCFSPLVLFFLGLASASFAGSLADTFYYEYKWYFRSGGLLFLFLSYFIWYKSKTKTCTLDKKKRIRKRFINMFLLSVVGFIVLYSVWLYVIVDYLGKIAQIWE